MMEFTFGDAVRQGFGFYNPNHAAALICALMPFLWGWKKYAPAGWILTLLLTVPLAMTYSRTGVLVLAFELTAYFILGKNRNWRRAAFLAAGILLILAIGGVFGRFAFDNALANRPQIWLSGLKLYVANPLGVGIGNSGLLVSTFLLDGITCRTLVNSHLTLLAEGGLFAGILWFGVIFYALLRGTGNVRAWCSSAGLCISAFSASVFDWDLLTDFRNFGNLPLLNFVLSWSLLIFFLLLAAYLVMGKIQMKRLGIAAGLVLLCTALPLCLRSPQTPKLEDNAVCTSSGAPLVLYDEEWDMKSVLPYCGDDFRIPLKPGFYPDRRKELSRSGNAREKRLFLFGNAAEYAAEFPESRIVYVNPPEFFDPAPNAVKIFLPRHDPREFPFETERY